jgi:hypothetical protein
VESWFEAGAENVVAVVNVVGVVDGTDGAVARDDVAGDGGDDGLVGVSLACVPVSQVLGSSVDVPALFRRRSFSSSCTVCVTALIVLVGVVCVLESIVSRIVGSVCASSSTRMHVCVSMHFPWPWFVSHTSRSAVFPFSSPSFIPFSYPSFNSAVFPFSSDLAIASLTTEYVSSRPRAIIAS